MAAERTDELRSDPDHGSSDGVDCLQRFLAWLGEERYIFLHRKLVFFFECNGSGGRCEELADMALDRVARKFCADQAPGLEAINSYVLRSGRFVLMEDFKQRNKTAVLDTDPPDAADPPRLDPAQDKCFEKCLNRLAPGEREQLLQFYRFQGREKIAAHKQFANSLGITENALRVRIHRIRTRLRGCCDACLQGQL